MGIAAEIGQHLLGAAEGRLGVDHPLDPAQRAQPMGEGCGSGEAGELAEEAEFAGLERRAQLVEEQPAEEPREHADRQEEAGPAGDPARAVRRQAAAGHDAMDVRMVVQVLAPGVEHGDEADLGAEMLGIGGDPAQRLGRRSEQDGVDRLLVLEGDLGDRRRQGEDDVEVGHRQQLGLPGGEPFGAGLPLALRAVPVAAGVVGACGPARSRRSARHDRPAPPSGTARSRHHAPLDAAEVAVMGPAIGVAVAAEDIRHLQVG